MFYRKVKTENWSTLQCYTYQIQKQRQQWMHLHHVNGEMLLHHSATKQQRNKIHTQILRAKPPYKTDSKHAMLSIVLPSEISSIKHLVRVDSFQATLQRCFHTHTHTDAPTHPHTQADPAIQLGHVRLIWPTHIFKLLITDNLLTVVQFGPDAKIYMAHAV